VDPLDTEQSLRYSFQFNYDTTYIRYFSFEKDRTISENLDVSVLEKTLGALQIDASEGTPADTSGTLLLLGFEAKREKATHIFPVSFLNPSLVQPCLPLVEFADTMLILDGVCMPLVVKKSAFSLKQNHPNPISVTNGSVTSIEFSVSGTGHASLEIYDMVGRRVATLVNEELAAGVHVVSFSPSQLPKGMYSYMLREGGNVAVKKLMWLQ
jgi:hypothetical protein